MRQQPFIRNIKRIAHNFLRVFSPLKGGPNKTKITPYDLIDGRIDDNPENRNNSTFPRIDSYTLFH
jgi:hypothetical protein